MQKARQSVCHNQEKGTDIYLVGRGHCTGQPSPPGKRAVWPSLEAKSLWIQAVLNTNGVPQGRENRMSPEWGGVVHGNTQTCTPVEARGPPGVLVPGAVYLPFKCFFF